MRYACHIHDLNKNAPYISLRFMKLPTIFWLLSFFTLWDKGVHGCSVPKGKDCRSSGVFSQQSFFPSGWRNPSFLFVCLCLFFQGTGSYSFRDHETGFRHWGSLQKVNNCRLFFFHYLWFRCGLMDQSWHMEPAEWLQGKICHAFFSFFFSPLC